MAKEGETFFFLFDNLPCQLIRFPRQLVYSSLVYLSTRHSSTCLLVPRQLVNLIQYSLNYAKKYIKFCRL